MSNNRPHFYVCQLKRLMFLVLEGSLLRGVKNPLHDAILPAPENEKNELLDKWVYKKILTVIGTIQDV